MIFPNIGVGDKDAVKKLINQDSSLLKSEDKKKFIPYEYAVRKLEFREKDLAKELAKKPRNKDEVEGAHKEMLAAYAIVDMLRDATLDYAKQTNNEALKARILSKPQTTNQYGFFSMPSSSSSSSSSSDASKEIEKLEKELKALEFSHEDDKKEILMKALKDLHSINVDMIKSMR